MKIILNILFLFFKKIRINKIYYETIEIFYNKNFKFENDLICFGFLLDISFAFIWTFCFLYFFYTYIFEYLKNYKYLSDFSSFFFFFCANYTNYM